MKNNDIRGEIAKAGLFLYQVAEAMNVKPNTISHYLMSDLSKPQKERIRQAIATARRDLKNGKKEQ